MLPSKNPLFSNLLSLREKKYFTTKPVITATNKLSEQNLIFYYTHVIENALRFRNFELKNDLHNIGRVVRKLDEFSKKKVKKKNAFLNEKNNL